MANGMEPGSTPVYARHEILIPAPPDRVWRWLIRSELWPSWHSDIGWVRFESGSGPYLALDRPFSWKIFEVTVQSTVKVFEPLRELGWDGHGMLTAYHGWLLTPEASGCRVVTEGTQRGLVPAVGRWVLRRMVLRAHQNWVGCLSGVAPRPATRPDRHAYAIHESA